MHGCEQGRILVCMHAQMQAMRPPSVVFPVGDLATCTALPARAIASGGMLLGGEDAKARAAEGETLAVMP